MRKRITVLGFFSEDIGLTCFFKTNYRALLADGYEFNIINIANYRPARELKHFGNYYEVPFYFTDIKDKHFLRKRRTFNHQLHQVYRECLLNSDVIHLYLNMLCDPVPIVYARRLGFDRVIVHAYSNFEGTMNLTSRQLQKVGRRMAEVYGTDFLAVTQGAADFFFSSRIQRSPRFKLLPDGIAVRKQRYHEEQNIYYRKRYDINENDFVIGNIGRFIDVKNQSFLVDSFNLFQKINPNAKLVLIGDGPKLEEVRQKVYQLHLEGRVIFTGYLENTEEVQNIFDVFAYPAESGGLSLALLHSLANGAKAVVSQRQPAEVQTLGAVTALSIDNPQSWADEFHSLSLETNNRFEQSYSTMNELIEKGYTISTSTKLLRKLYGKPQLEDDY